MKTKWLLIWTVLHTISIILILLIINPFDIQNQFIKYLLVGSGVTLLANIWRIVTKNRFLINSSFILWTALNSMIIFLTTILNNSLHINNLFISSLFIGFWLVIGSYLVYFLNITHIKWLKYPILVVIIFIILSFSINDYPLISRFNEIEGLKIISTNDSESNSTLEIPKNIIKIKTIENISDK